MTAFLPPNLLALFAPRDPVPFLPPVDKLSHEKKRQPYTGVGGFFGSFEDPKDTPPPTRVETREERLERKRREKAEQVAYKLEQDIALWDPHNIPEGTSDAFKTLFVARINYDTSESKLRREFEGYGPIKKIAMVPDKKSGKPRGYAFIEYEHERDMHSAYKHADGKKIDGRRVLVDVERSRTVKGWLPRRLGGGLGGTRKGGPEVNVKHSGRDDASRHDSREREREREPPKERERERDKERDRERERERERRRSRSRTREKERRRRSVSSRPKDRRRDRRKRSRERSRERDRDRDKENEEREVPEEMEDRKDFRDERKDIREDRKDIREDRKEIRDDKKDIRDDKKEVQKEIRERRRSRSRDRKRSRRSRSRDRERERRRRGGEHDDRDRDRDRNREPREDTIIMDGVVIKTEPTSDNEEDSHGDFNSSNQDNYNYGGGSGGGGDSGAYDDDDAQQGYGAQN